MQRAVRTRAYRPRNQLAWRKPSRKKIIQDIQATEPGYVPKSHILDEGSWVGAALHDSDRPAHHTRFVLVLRDQRSKVD